MIDNRSARSNRWRRGFYTLGAGTLLAGAALTVSAGPAAADAQYVGIQSVHTGYCLDDSFSSGLRAISCNGLGYQTWTATTKSNVSFALQNAHTGYCLDDSYSSGLRAIPCNGLDYQIWTYASGPDGSFSLHNNHTGYCLDDSFSSGLRAISCNGLDYQNWLLQ